MLTHERLKITGGIQIKSEISYIKKETEVEKQISKQKQKTVIPGPCNHCSKEIWISCA